MVTSGSGDGDVRWRSLPLARFRHASLLSIARTV